MVSNVGCLFTTQDFSSLDVTAVTHFILVVLRLNYLNIHTGYVNLKAGPFADHTVFLPLSLATAVMAASLESAPHESACRSVCMYIICTYLYLDLGLVCVPAGFPLDLIMNPTYNHAGSLEKNTVNKLFWVITAGKKDPVFLDGWLFKCEAVCCT